MIRTIYHSEGVMTKFMGTRKPFAILAVYSIEQNYRIFANFL